jgi:hypothetical protein
MAAHCSTWPSAGNCELGTDGLRFNANVYFRECILRPLPLKAGFCVTGRRLFNASGRICEVNRGFCGFAGQKARFTKPAHPGQSLGKFLTKCTELVRKGKKETRTKIKTATRLTENMVPTFARSGCNRLVAPTNAAIAARVTTRTGSKPEFAVKPVRADQRGETGFRVFEESPVLLARPLRPKSWVFCEAQGTRRRGLRGRGGSPGDEPKLTSLWPVLNPLSGSKTEPFAPVKPVQTSAPFWRTRGHARERFSLPSKLVLPVRFGKGHLSLSR